MRRVAHRRLQGRSERLADDLTKLGFQNVRRYQLGVPGWRALGGIMQVEKPALLRLLAQDATAVLIDARAAAGLKPRRLRNGVSIPLPEASKAKDDGRLPLYAVQWAIRRSGHEDVVHPIMFLPSIRVYRSKGPSCGSSPAK